MADLYPLSNREQDVVNQLRQGKSNKLIASSLGISERTVEFHLTNIYAKLQVSSRTELVLKLGDSTVAAEGATPENEGGSSSQNWASSLKATISKVSKEFTVEDSLKADVRDSSGPMTFFESLRVCLTQKFAEFNGRASRSEFWWFAVFVLLVASALAYLSEAAVSIFLIAVLLPFLAVGARRLRDSGNSPWWLWFLLVPIGGIITLGILWAQPSTEPPADETLKG
jgi:DNA-binding CsgD family transcriptional regulator